MEGHSSDCLASTPQNCQGHEKQGKSEELSQARDRKGDGMTKCSVCLDGTLLYSTMYNYFVGSENQNTSVAKVCDPVS